MPLTGHFFGSSGTFHRQLTATGRRDLEKRRIVLTTRIEATDNHPTLTPNLPQVIVLSKKLFCLILIGLASLAAASLCSILSLPMSKAVLLFLGTWVVLITLFEVGTLFQSPTQHLRETSKHK